MMRTLKLVLFAITCLCWTQVAEAREWTGVQYNLGASAEYKIPHTELGAFGQVSWFKNYELQQEMLTFYNGPVLYLVVAGERQTFWISPMFLIASGAFPDHDAYGPSLWISYNYAKTIQVFGEVDRWFAGGGNHLWYGYGALDWFPLPWVKVGAQSENIDDQVHVGPHAGVSHGALSVTVSYYAGITGPDTTNSLRVGILIQALSPKPTKPTSQ